MNIKQATYKIQKRNKISSFFIGLLKFLLILIVLILISIIIAESLIFLYLKDIHNKVAQDYEKLIVGINTRYANSRIVDINGKELAILNGDEKRQIISLEEMSSYLPKAYLSIEDERFYEHQGVDIKRTANAIYTYLKNEGSSSFGGSSITQQLVKNITNDKESSINRKIKEWILAFQLEQTLSKDKILEKYLNIIFVGGDVYGVELGSQYYFNKSAKDLSLAECAYLAGLTHSPNLYNPFKDLNNEELIKKRTKIVLRQNVRIKQNNIRRIQKCNIRGSKWFKV